MGCFMLELDYIKRDVFKNVFENSNGMNNKEITKVLINELEDAMKVAVDLEDKMLFVFFVEEFIRRIEAFYGYIPIEKYMIVKTIYDIDYKKVKAIYIKRHLDRDKINKDLKEYLNEMIKQVKEFIKFYDEVSSILEEESTKYLKNTIDKRNE